MSRLFQQAPRPVERDRLPPAELSNLRKALAAAGHVLPEGQGVDDKLNHLRQMYEPYLNALGRFLLMSLPEWLPRASAKDDWERTAKFHRGRIRGIQPSHELSVVSKSASRISFASGDRRRRIHRLVVYFH